MEIIKMRWEAVLMGSEGYNIYAKPGKPRSKLTDDEYYQSLSPIARLGCVGVKEQKPIACLIEQAPRLYEELVIADEVICKLCKRLNPQHVTADYGKGCDWCQDRDNRLKAIAKVEGKRE